MRRFFSCDAAYYVCVCECVCGYYVALCMSLWESGLQERVARRSQRNGMVRPGSVGINSTSPWVALHQCQRGDGRGPGHVNTPLPFAFPEATPGHVLPLQPIKGNSVRPVGVCSVAAARHSCTAHRLTAFLAHFLVLSLTALGLPSQLRQPRRSLCLSIF